MGGGERGGTIVLWEGEEKWRGEYLQHYLVTCSRLLESRVARGWFGISTQPPDGIGWGPETAAASGEKMSGPRISKQPPDGERVGPELLVASGEKMRGPELLHILQTEEDWPRTVSGLWRRDRGPRISIRPPEWVSPELSAASDKEMEGPEFCLLPPEWKGWAQNILQHL